MQFHASKIVSALILLKTTICLAMHRSIGFDPYKIEIEFATCENRVFSKMQISKAIKGGLQSIRLMEGSKMKLDTLQYRPQPTEVMPSKEKFYFSKFKRLGRNGPTDMVIFSSSGLFAKVVTRVLHSQGLKYIDCVASQTIPSPHELQPILGFPGQNSEGHDPFEIGISSVSCEGRVYNERQISMAIISGLQNIILMEESKMKLDTVQYIPNPAEVMPFNDEFYFSELNRLGPNGPIDSVIFSSSGQFAKVVFQIEHSGENLYKDCVSLSNKQYPERPQLRKGSPERPQLRKGSPERPRMRKGSPERPRMRKGSLKRSQLRRESLKRLQQRLKLLEQESFE